VASRAGRRRRGRLGALELGHLRQPQLLEPELGGQRVDLRLEGRRIDAEQHLARLDRRVGQHRHSITSPATSGTIATDGRMTTAGPLGAPQPIGMNRPNSSSINTMAGETFQNRLKGTILSFTSPNRTPGRC